MNLSANTLVIDGSGSSLFAGLLDARGAWQATALRDCAALEGLFPAVESILKAANKDFADVDAYIYCEGPGSVLSLRLCAMAIETWRRLKPHPTTIYKYNSLQLAAHQCLADKPDLSDALIVSDWKKGAWNALTIRDRKVGPVTVLDDEELAAWSGPLYHLPQRKGWQSPPPAATTIAHNPACLERLHERPGLLQPTDSVELYNTGVNTFRKWTPTRHRAPA
ncbi:MAG: hypothetical protein GVY36_06895 [Verrucomicrobia bacterium]|jgi:tRNA threonylcarbamoyladenosine biosynthesis protein TsaB|nr:hypothetical protein [Verrucomicrobiota bacterium]